MVATSRVVNSVFMVVNWLNVALVVVLVIKSVLSIMVSIVLYIIVEMIFVDVR